MDNAWTRKDRDDFVRLIDDVKDLNEEKANTRRKIGNIFDRLGEIERRVETRFAEDDQRRKTFGWVFRTLGAIATISTGAGMLAVMLWGQL